MAGGASILALGAIAGTMFVCGALCFRAALLLGQLDGGPGPTGRSRRARRAQDSSNGRCGARERSEARTLIEAEREVLIVA